MRSSGNDIFVFAFPSRSQAEPYHHPAVESDMRSGSAIVTQQPDTHRVWAVGQWTGALLEGSLQTCTATQDVPSQDTALI